MEIILDGKIGVSDIVSLILSFIALRIALNNRKSPLREIVYEKQLLVFQELLDRIVEIEDKMAEWEMEKQLLNNKTVLKEIETRLFSVTEEFQLHIQKVEIFIPKQIHGKFGALLDYINSIRIGVFDKKIQSINVDELAEMVFALKNEIRKFMGLDYLASETNKMISK